MKKELKILIIWSVGFLIASLWAWFFVFNGGVILPQNLNFFGLKIYLYGLVLVVAALFGYFILKSRLEKTVINADSLFLYVFISGFIGARVYHVLVEYSYYLYNPTKILFIWNGGLSIFGALLGGFIGLLLYMRLNKINMSLLEALDLLVLPTLLAQSIGRWGNFVNYEAYGLAKFLPGQMFVPQNFREPLFLSTSYYTPIFWYESLGCLLLAYFLLLWFSKKTNKIHGLISAFYLIGYGLIRLFSEIYRVDNTILFSFKINILMAIAVVLLGLLLLYLLKYSNITTSSKHSL